MARFRSNKPVRKLVVRLERSTYQPWAYGYPSFAQECLLCGLAWGPRHGLWGWLHGHGPYCPRCVKQKDDLVRSQLGDYQPR